jgi:hypothetical protein
LFLPEKKSCHASKSKQTLRVSLQQATTILVAFISEQLELDLKRNIKVNEGELTQLEADLEAEEWEKVRVVLCYVDCLSCKCESQ